VRPRFRRRRASPRAQLAVEFITVLLYQHKAKWTLVLRTNDCEILHCYISMPPSACQPLDGRSIVWRRSSLFLVFEKLLDAVPAANQFLARRARHFGRVTGLCVRRLIVSTLYQRESPTNDRTHSSCGTETGRFVTISAGYLDRGSTRSPSRPCVRRGPCATADEQSDRVRTLSADPSFGIL